MGTSALCRHSLLPGVALSQPCGCAQAPGRQPKGHDAARLPRSIASMVPHSNTLAWKISWTEEPGGLQSVGS